MRQGSFVSAEHVKTFLQGIKAVLGTIRIHSPISMKCPSTSKLEYEESEKRTDKLIIEVSEQEAEMGGRNSVKIFGVMLSTATGTWQEVFGSQEHLEIFVMAIKATLEVMGNPSKFEFPLKIPNEIEIKIKKIITNQQKLKV